MEGERKLNEERREDRERRQKISVIEKRDKELSYKIMLIDGAGGGGRLKPCGQTSSWS